MSQNFLDLIVVGNHTRLLTFTWLLVPTSWIGSSCEKYIVHKKIQISCHWTYAIAHKRNITKFNCQQYWTLFVIHYIKALSFSFSSWVSTWMQVGYHVHKTCRLPKCLFSCGIWSSWKFHNDKKMIFSLLCNLLTPKEGKYNFLRSCCIFLKYRFDLFG